MIQTRMKKKNLNSYSIDKAHLEMLLDANNQMSLLAPSPSAPILAHNNSHVFPISTKCSGWESNQSQNTGGVLAKFCNTLKRHKNFATSLALSTITVDQGAPSTNATWDDNLTTFRTNEQNTGLESKELMDNGDVVASLRKMVKQLVSTPSNTLPSSLHGRFNVSEEIPANSIWDNDDMSQLQK